ncbi:uncharacterized protein B0I36DRAFT_408244 [Microdochium trichocladiopsis]|uniref:BTB domain-containing protein n=1 Tax=Microdochium trichocladiopsis TaxID=1682393 RepID=A0A9P8Y9S0_9PEZI|nr:uncharacterized protein B0I36DRAFT_408244 [Microdochium trichocladiopsis]KAH7033588.1 hypothetical protein B0I36DRAFT_408244 [Microdochium trichocladiopsis]
MATAVSDPDPAMGSSQVDIAEDGDVILVIGAKPEQKKLRVYSQCLKASSKVFKAMFSGNWREGLNLSEDAPPSVELPEDHPRAMLYICRTIHYACSGSTLDESTLAAEILKIAVQADKYDLMHIFGGQIGRALASPPLETMEDRLYCLSAALMIKDEPAIKTASFGVVSRHVGRYSKFMDNDLLRAFLTYDNICEYSLCIRRVEWYLSSFDHPTDLLEEARTLLRMELLALLDQEIVRDQDDGYDHANCYPMADNFSNLRRAWSALDLLRKPAIDLIIGIQNIYIVDSANPRCFKWELEGYPGPCAEELHKRLIGLCTQVRDLFIQEE